MGVEKGSFGALQGVRSLPMFASRILGRRLGHRWRNVCRAWALVRAHPATTAGTRLLLEVALAQCSQTRLLAQIRFLVRMRARYPFQTRFPRHLEGCWIPNHRYAGQSCL